MPTLDDLPLFARATDPSTSHRAADSMREAASGQRRRCLLFLRASGPMTAAELDCVIGWRVTTAGRRLVELERLGQVQRTEEERPTPSGRAAQVWKAR